MIINAQVYASDKHGMPRVNCWSKETALCFVLLHTDHLADLEGYLAILRHANQRTWSSPAPTWRAPASSAIDARDHGFIFAVTDSKILSLADTLQADDATRRPRLTPTRPNLRDTPFAKKKKKNSTGKVTSAKYSNGLVNREEMGRKSKKEWERN